LYKERQQHILENLRRDCDGSFSYTIYHLEAKQINNYFNI